MGEVIQFDGIRRRVAFQPTTAANGNKQTKSSRFSGNRYTQIQLPFAVLTSDNWGQAARKVGGYKLAFEVLKREFEGRPEPSSARRKAA